MELEGFENEETWPYWQLLARQGAFTSDFLCRGWGLDRGAAFIKRSAASLFNPPLLTLRKASPNS